MDNYPDMISDCESIGCTRESAIQFINFKLNDICCEPDHAHEYNSKYAVYRNQYFMAIIKKCPLEYDALLFLAIFYSDLDIIAESLTNFIKDFLRFKKLIFVIDGNTKKDMILQKCKLKCICDVEKKGHKELVKVFA